MSIGVFNYTPTPDAIKITCDQCQAEMWMGPRQAAMLEADITLTTLCFVCVAKIPGMSSTYSLGGTSGKYKIDPSE